MSVELRISFDGTTPGLKEHRLSLVAFAKPLQHLVAAIRRTASAIVASGSEDPAYGSRGGKLADPAKLIDLELVAIEKGSAAPYFVCTARSPGLPQLAIRGLGTPANDLAEMSVDRFLRDIEAEGSGKRQSHSVRRFLKSIPEGVTSQRYVASSGGRMIREVRVATVNLAKALNPLPRLVQITGDVIGVGFEPGQSFVVLKSGTRSIKCTATTPQVEAALHLRADRITAAVLEGERPVLLWIRGAEVSAPVPALGETIEHLHTDWANTLKVLAQ
jgi:hypothetical protein